MELPHTFCWTRFGAEAGQPIDAIFARKEQERQENGGVFLWGIGNNISPSLPTLLRDERQPKVLFSPIRSKPQTHDVQPAEIAVWTRAIGADGRLFSIPDASLVTSRYTLNKKKHFALVCRSLHPLRDMERPKQISMKALRNAKTGNPVGFSQVTAIVRRDRDDDDLIAEYPVALCCELVAPYVITLECPIVVSGEETTESAWAASRRNIKNEEPIQLDFAV